MATKLTKRVIDAARAPAKGLRVVRDTEVRGFCIVIQAPTGLSPNGKRTFAFAYVRRGFARRMSIGHWPTYTCEEARDIARGLRKRLDAGHDPAQERMA